LPHKAASNRVVYHFFERTAGATRFRFELCSNIWVEGNGRAHIMMLLERHHDVNCGFSLSLG
jgi:hypothetical protein